MDHGTSGKIDELTASNPCDHVANCPIGRIHSHDKETLCCIETLNYFYVLIHNLESCNESYFGMEDPWGLLGGRVELAGH